MAVRWPPGRVARDTSLVLCPFLAGPDPVRAFWLGPLAWHDANGSLLAAIAGARPPRCTVFAGVFCVDPFRRDEDIFAALRDAGIGGVVNLPSVSFLDGELAGILGSFDLGAQREIDFLARARGFGLRVAGCAGDADAADRLVRAGAELIIAHAGPPRPGVADPGRPMATRLRRRFGEATPVVSVGELLATIG